MTLFRTWCVLVGVLGLLVVTAAIAHPAVKPALPIDAVGMDYLVVAGVGVVVFVVAGGLFGVRTLGSIHEANPRVVETSHHAGPGEIVAASMESLPSIRITDTHRRLYSQLRQLTITAIVQRQHCSRTDARARIRQGTWTDDPTAAAFLRSPEFVPPPLHTRCRELITGRQWFRYRVVATVHALEQLEGIENQ